MQKENSQRFLALVATLARWVDVLQHRMMLLIKFSHWQFVELKLKYFASFDELVRDVTTQKEFDRIYLFYHSFFKSHSVCFEAIGVRGGCQHVMCLLCEVCKYILKLKKVAIWKQIESCVCV